MSEKQLGIDVDRNGRIWTSNSDSFYSKVNSSWIVRQLWSYCKENNIHTIFIEDYTSWPNSFKLKNKRLVQVLSLIDRYGKEEGFRIRKVNPKSSSITCSRCGNVNKRNRPFKTLFKCTSCRFSTNADINAAKNILQFGRKGK